MNRVLNTLLASMLILACATANTQIVINEISPFPGVADENAELQDWVELYNAGNTTVNLSGYGLSDRADEPDKYVFAPQYLDPGEHLLVLCSGGEFYYPAYYWGSTVLAFYPWTYNAATSEPPADWNMPTFDDSGWSSGPGPIGLGDGDDATTVSNCNSVYMRRDFEVEDAADMTYLVLNADYDDGFVAYLNGVEIARSYNVEGFPPAYNAGVTEGHEAQVYQGLPTEIFFGAQPFLGNILQEGTNTLAIHVLNSSLISSDLTGRFDLILGSQGSNTSLGAMPATLSFLPVVYLQAPFKLNPGEEVVLSNPGMQPIDIKPIPDDLQPGHAVGRFPSESPNWCTTNDPTPNNPQTADLCFAGYTQGPEVDPPSGYYTGTITVTASPAAPDHTLRYSTNGDAPKETDPEWPGTLTLNETSVLSIRAFSADGLPGIPVDRTYFINEDNHELQTASIITDSLNLWDWNTGIYVEGPNASQDYPYYGANFWEPWSKYSRLHWFDHNAQLNAEEEFDLEIHGGWSRAEAQRSFRMDLKGDFSGNLDQAIIPDKPWIQTYNNFNLRAGGQHIWTDKIQDAYLCRKLKGTFANYMAYEPVKVYLNGDFWGLYGIREKIDEKWAQYNFDLANDDVDLLNSWDVLAGDRQHFDAMLAELAADPTGPEFYNTASSYLDIQNHVDYIAAETFYQNLDWFGILWGANNIKCWRPRTPEGKWRYVVYDTDAAFGAFGGNANTNYLDAALNPLVANDHSYIFNRMVLNPEYRRYFINRYADLMNTTWQPAEFQQLMNEMKADMEDAMPEHIDRWDEMSNLFLWNIYTQGIADYAVDRLIGARENMLETFELPAMHVIQLEVDPPGAGYIEISTITPENYPWNGVYFENNSFEITAFPNPGYSFEHWEQNELLPADTEESEITINLTQTATFTAVFTGSPVSVDLQITEVNYHAADGHNTGDWVEIHNPSDTDVDISLHWLQDMNVQNKYTFPAGTVLEAGGYIVVAQDPDLFSAWHPEVDNVYGPAACEFDNSGDYVGLMDPWGNELFGFTYDDQYPWPIGADGRGHTLELMNPDAPGDPGSWVDGCMFGSPGFVAFPCVEYAMITEINASSSALFDTDDWVEITNTSNEIIDLQGWTLADDNGVGWEIAESVELLPGERAILARNADAFAAKFDCNTPEIIVGDFDFGLSSNGESVLLHNADGVLVHSVSYLTAAPWPTNVDGTGYTLELWDLNAFVNTGSFWANSECVGGTPGAAYTQFCSDPLQLGVELDGETLTANAMGGIPPYSITWFFNGVEVGTGTTWTVTDDGLYEAQVEDAAGCLQWSEIQIGVSVNEDNKQVIAAYPNPFTDQLTIQVPDFAGGLLEVRNMRGQLILQERLTGEWVAFQAEEWANGVYLITISTATSIQRVKVIKQ